MDRQNYQVPYIEIKRFSSDEIITASAPVTTRDPDKPIELPFVPAEIK